MSARLATKVVSGSMWSVAAELLAGGARAASYFVYARYLSPTDFGVIGYCLLIVNLFPMLFDNSLGLALVREREDNQRTFSVIFYLNVVLSLVAFILVSGTAGWAATFVGDEQVKFVLPLMCGQIILSSLCATHIAIARRRFQYRELAFIRLSSTFCSILFGLPLALEGKGYWALVVGSLTAAASQSLSAWLLIRWRPTWAFDWLAVKSIASFASWAGIDMLVTWMMMSGGGFILAFYLGTHDLGLFRLSDQINTYVLGAILTPLIPVFYSAFCAASDNQKETSLIFANVTRIVGLLAIVLGGMLVLSAGALESIVGERWHGLGAIVALNAIADVISYATLPIPSLLRAHGYAKVVAGMRMAMVVVQVAAYMVVAPHGLIAFVIAKMSLEFFVYAVSFAVLGSTLHFPVTSLVSGQVRSAAVAALSVFSGFLLVDKVGLSNPLVRLSISLIAFSILMVCLLFVTERQSLNYIVNAILRRRQRLDG